MILKNGKIYVNGLVRDAILLLDHEIIKSISYTHSDSKYKEFIKANDDGKEIDCKNRLILPGIIDIHSHLRDMGQSEKETFLSGTKAAAFSGITTVFNMPNTKPPAISSEQVKKWMNATKEKIYVDVGFIAGIPKGFNEDEIKNIIKLGVIGFKIYPLTPLNDINWKDPINFERLLNISSSHNIPIFIHADWPISDKKREKIRKEIGNEKDKSLIVHNKLHPPNGELKYVKFAINTYKKFLQKVKLNPKNYPDIHFCHISCIESYSFIQECLKSNPRYKISFEITPHHLLLSNDLKLKIENYGKVEPPLRDKNHQLFLYNELKKGNVKLIGTDHAPHTLKEKSQDFHRAPSGFPGFETYSLLMLNEIFQGNLTLESFVRVASENPAKRFNLESKGFIREGYYADLVLIQKVPEYPIIPKNFKTQALYSPFENFLTSVQIWKVFLRGIEINNDLIEPSGKVIKRSL